MRHVTRFAGREAGVRLLDTGNRHAGLLAIDESS